MASTAAPSTTTTSTTSAPTKPIVNKKLPQLLPLEDDDEFEEFPVEDWDQKDTYGHVLGKESNKNPKSNSTKGGLDSLWDDNWDNDDIADDFSVQLRGELLKQDQMQS